ncbi:hypothetical protein COB21_04510 [Candidatus Aerophobetes bacterium]|uniref:protein-tyrosine-phosphatase n=1 Tax=Aerophobetes bacterium TaxID=2030807 RepID=A0A2A4X1E2_UNCAE|nr:MAG: hypothetical protein COB21_04510 [Candidatus Aerophobetes bacterium]
MISILFVCYANLVRSPAFEACVKSLVAKCGASEKVYVDSCGIIESTSGQQASSRMVEIAARDGITIEHSAKVFQDSFFDQFSAIFAVDETIFKALFEKEACSKWRKKLYRTAHFSSDDKRDLANPLEGEKSYLATWNTIKEQSSAIFTHYISPQL